MRNFYRTLSFAGLGIVRASHLAQLQKIEADAYGLLQDLALRHGARPEHIKSQIGQDLFALYALQWKRDGYFVEFGATNGVDLSNSYLLEKDFGWKGILAELAKIWHAALLKNWTVSIDFDCVWKESGSEMQFAVTENAEFSTLGDFAASDAHKRSRKSAIWQPVKTISLNDLLERHAAPRQIDYLSIDTEGSELDILRAFDFDRHIFSVITCEHNYSSNRNDLYQLLVRHGYMRVFEGLSRWDDWYVHSSVQAMHYLR